MFFCITMMRLPLDDRLTFLRFGASEEEDWRRSQLDQVIQRKYMMVSLASFKGPDK